MPDKVIPPDTKEPARLYGERSGNRKLVIFLGGGGETTPVTNPKITHHVTKWACWEVL